jgi:oxygen-dependent protoporphyrinogen oxidase
MGDSFLDYAIDPFVKGVYAGDPNYLIPKYALPKLYNLEQTYGSLIGGSVKKSFQKKSEMEKRANRKVFSFKNGLSSFISALEKSIGNENIICGIQNWNVKPLENGFLVEFTDKSGNTQTLAAPKVVSTLGAWALESTLPFIEKQDMEAINSLHYTRVVEVSLGFNQWKGIPLDGFGGLIPSKENRDILGVLYMSTLFENRAPKEGALITIFMGGVTRQDIYEKSESELKAIVEKECKDLMELKEFSPDYMHVIRHEKAIPQYGIESGKRFETISKIQQTYPGLFLAGNIRDGIGMADRIQQAKKISDEISH